MFDSNHPVSLILRPLSSSSESSPSASSFVHYPPLPPSPSPAPGRYILAAPPSSPAAPKKAPLPARGLHPSSKLDAPRTLWSLDAALKEAAGQALGTSSSSTPSRPILSLALNQAFEALLFSGGEAGRTLFQNALKSKESRRADLQYEIARKLLYDESNNARALTSTQIADVTWAFQLMKVSDSELILPLEGKLTFMIIRSKTLEALVDVSSLILQLRTLDRTLIDTLANRITKLTFNKPADLQSIARIVPILPRLFLKSPAVHTAMVILAMKTSKLLKSEAATLDPDAIVAMLLGFGNCHQISSDLIKKAMGTLSRWITPTVVESLTMEQACCIVNRLALSWVDEMTTSMVVLAARLSKEKCSLDQMASLAWSLGHSNLKSDAIEFHLLTLAVRLLDHYSAPGGLVLEAPQLMNFVSGFSKMRICKQSVSVMETLQKEFRSNLAKHMAPEQRRAVSDWLKQFGDRTPSGLEQHPRKVGERLRTISRLEIAFDE